MKKLALLSAGAAMAAAAILGSASAQADPVASANPINVTNMPYAQAVKILKGQGVKYLFGGSVGSDVPQSQCVVAKQTLVPGGKYRLMLDCTTAAVESAAGSAVAAPAAPAAPGAPGAPAAPGGAPKTPGQGTYGGPIGVPVAVG